MTVKYKIREEILYRNFQYCGVIGIIKRIDDTHAYINFGTGREIPISLKYVEELKF